jgi:hypothetical protein
MKKLILALAILAGTGSVVMAQSKQAQPTATSIVDDAKAEADKLNKLVTLTPAQLKQVQDLNTMLLRRKSAVNDNADGNARIAGELDKYKADQYRQILNPEQYKKWEANQAKK